MEQCSRVGWQSRRTVETNSNGRPKGEGGRRQERGTWSSASEIARHDVHLVQVGSFLLLCPYEFWVAKGEEVIIVQQAWRWDTDLSTTVRLKKVGERSMPSITLSLGTVPPANFVNVVNRSIKLPSWCDTCHIIIIGILVIKLPSWCDTSHHHHRYHCHQYPSWCDTCHIIITGIIVINLPSWCDTCHIISSGIIVINLSSWCDTCHIIITGIIVINLPSWCDTCHIIIITGIIVINLPSWCDTCHIIITGITAINIPAGVIHHIIITGIIVINIPAGVTPVISSSQVSLSSISQLVWYLSHHHHRYHCHQYPSWCDTCHIIITGIIVINIPAGVIHVTLSPTSSIPLRWLCWLTGGKTTNSSSQQQLPSSLSSYKLAWSFCCCPHCCCCPHYSLNTIIVAISSQKKSQQSSILITLKRSVTFCSRSNELQTSHFAKLKYIQSNICTGWSFRLVQYFFLNKKLKTFFSSENIV